MAKRAKVMLLMYQNENLFIISVCVYVLIELELHPVTPIGGS